jgi:uncharacterized protein YjbI with pentapeptide repeats
MQRALILLLVLITPLAALAAERKLATRSAVDFSGVHRPLADFRNADLRGANLSHGNFRGANFTGADLRGANLEGADFGPSSALDRGMRSVLPTSLFALVLVVGTMVTLRRINGGSPRAEARRGKSLGCLGAALLGLGTLVLLLVARANQTQMTEADLTGANLRGSDLSQAWLRNACLRDADLTGAKLERTKLWVTFMPGAKLAGVDRRRADVQWAYRPEGDLDLGEPRANDSLRSTDYFDAIPDAERERYSPFDASSAAKIVTALIGHSVVTEPDRSLNELIPAVQSCRALGSGGIRIKGRVLMWVMNPDRDEEPIPDLLPGELEALRSDPRFTVLIMHYRPDLIGSYGSGSGYRRDTDFYAYSWPDRKPLGFQTVPGEPPPEVVTHESGERVGRVYGPYEKPQVLWLRSLPREWTHFLRYPPKRPRRKV